MGCLFPVNIPNPKYGKVVGAFQYIPGRCGKCANCLKERADAWVFKLSQQAKAEDCQVHYFVTLTYSDEALLEPGLGRITKNGYQNLVKRDFQLFMKKLRGYYRKCKGMKIRYYAVGEYGFQYERPHFHAIIFNADQSAIEKAWEHGWAQVEIPKHGNDSMAYVAKYMTKGKMIPKHENDDREPEFQLFSKGLGSNYITPEIVRWHNADPLNRNYIPLEGGYGMTIPQWFRKHLFSEEVLNKISNHNSMDWTIKEKERERRYLHNHGDFENYYKDNHESRMACHYVYIQRARARRK